MLLKGSGLKSGLSDKGVMTISRRGSHTLAFTQEEHGDISMNSKKNVLASAIAFFVGAGGAFAQESASAKSTGFVMCTGLGVGPN